LIGVKFLLAVTLASIGNILLVPAASGETASQAAAWGLHGTWARDCKSPPSDKNGWFTFRPNTPPSRAGTRELTFLVPTHPLNRAEWGNWKHDYGRFNFSSAFTVERANSGKLEIATRNPMFPEVAQIVLEMEKSDDHRIRMLMTKTADPDSTFQPTGKPTEWLTRCERQTS
jgi:hypothetical protein